MKKCHKEVAIQPLFLYNRDINTQTNETCGDTHTKLNQVDKTNFCTENYDRGQWVESQIGLDLSSNLNDFEDGEKLLRVVKPLLLLWSIIV